MTLGRPQFQLRIARRPNLQQGIVAAIVELDAGDGLGVAAVEVLGDTQHGGEPSHDLAALPSELVEIGVPPRRRRAAVITGDQRNRFDLVRLEAAQIAVSDQVIGMAMMPFVADVHAGVMQDRRVLQPLALLVGHPVDRPGAVEESQRQPRDLVSMIRPVAAALGQLDDAAPPHVRIPIGLGDFLAVLGDVIEHQAFAQRQVAEAEFVGIQPFQNRVEKNRARYREVGPARIQSRNFQPLFEVERGQLLADTVNLLGRDASIADRRGALAFAGGDGAEAENRARRSDDAIEAGVHDLFEVVVELGLNVLDEFSLVARRDRVALDEPFGEPDDADLEAPAEIDGRPGAARDFDAAAADVDDDADFARHPETVGGGEMDQARFFGARQHARANAGLADDGVQKFAAVFGFAHRAGGAGNDVIDLMGGRQTAELR